MPNLNGDILYLIFKELEPNEVFRSCLLVNKAWCQIIIPTLWKDPWKYLKQRKQKLFLNVIISHLSDKTRNNLIQNIDSDFLKKSYKEPYFDYIRYCRNLNLIEIEKLINITSKKSSEIPNIRNTILNLFVNERTRFTHLNIPHNFKIELHLISGAERCFSELRSLRCNTGVSDKILTGLTGMCKSINELQLSIGEDKNSYEIIKLIENSEKLSNINLTNSHSKIDKPFCKVLENSLIKHVNSIQYFTISKLPVTNILLSPFVNLKCLELNDSNHNMSWNSLENLSLPLLQILKAKYVPIDALEKIIKNANKSLIEININDEYHDVNNNKKIIQAIYRNCSNLKYLKLLLWNDNIPELEKLLIECENLDVLYITFNFYDDINWYYLFNISTKFSPISLFKFKFHFTEEQEPDLESLKLFFKNWKIWKKRHPLLLQFPKMRNTRYINLMEKYKSKKIIKKYVNVSDENILEDFEWTRECFS
jgi:hypothetical protein